VTLLAPKNHLHKHSPLDAWATKVKCIPANNKKCLHNRSKYLPPFGHKQSTPLMKIYSSTGGIGYILQSTHQSKYSTSRYTRLPNYSNVQSSTDASATRRYRSVYLPVCSL